MPSKMASSPSCRLPICFIFLIFVPTVFLINTILQPSRESIKLHGENSKQKPMFANGDDHPLISIVCSNTSLPEYCVKCFYFNPQSKQETDIRRLGSVSIDCALYQSLALGKLFYRYYASNTTETQVEEFHNKCRIIYNNYQALDSSALNLYQESEFQIRASQDAQYMCIDLIIVASLPNDLASSLYHFEAFASASSDVIHQI